MRLPEGVEPLSSAQLHVLVGVVAEQRESRRVTVRAVCDRADLSSTSTAHSHLKALRDRGWVAWTEGTAGTLRPRAVAVEGPGLR